MPFPVGWPPRRPSGTRSIRFFVTGTCTANFQDNAYLFVDGTGANPFTSMPVVPPGGEATPARIGYDPALGQDAGTPVGTGPASVRPGAPEPTPQADIPKATIWANTIHVRNDGAGALEVSFDGSNVHDFVKANEVIIYRNRAEGGISVRGVAGSTPTFRIAAW